MPIPSPLTKTDHVYRLLKEDILEGRLPSGSRLRLAELAETYSISEMPVREALRMLQRDGLVLFESHRGAMVAELSFSELVDVIETRTYLELLAVSEAAPHHNEKTLAELDELIRKMNGRKVATQYSALNHAFHRALYEPCPNQFLKNVINELWERAWRRWSKSLFELRPDRRKQATAEHKQIVAALRTGDLHQVEAAVRTHRDNTLMAWRSFSEMKKAEGDLGEPLPFGRA